jgi:hypothetical protein
VILVLVVLVVVEHRQHVGQGDLLIEIQHYRVLGGAVVGQTYRSAREPLRDEGAAHSVAAQAEQGHAILATRDRWGWVAHVAHPVCAAGVNSALAWMSAAHS